MRIQIVHLVSIYAQKDSFAHRYGFFEICGSVPLDLGLFGPVARSRRAFYLRRAAGGCFGGHGKLTSGFGRWLRSDGCGLRGFGRWHWLRALAACCGLRALALAAVCWLRSDGFGRWRWLRSAGCVLMAAGCVASGAGLLAAGCGLRGFGRWLRSAGCVASGAGLLAAVCGRWPSAFVCFRGDDRFFLPCLAWRPGADPGGIVRTLRLQLPALRIYIPRRADSVDHRTQKNL